MGCAAQAVHLTLCKASAHIIGCKAFDISQLSRYSKGRYQTGREMILRYLAEAHLFW